jgi:hypothetical protein
MSDIEKQIARKVDAFVTEISGLLRQAALQQAADHLVRQARGGNGVAAGRRAARAASAGGRRSPRVLSAITTRLEAAIKAKPGRRIEEIGAELGVPTRTLKLPIKKLLRGKQITRKGHRRGTRYFGK